MRFSLVALASLASLAVASPLRKNLDKKAVIWDIITDVVWVTVTADGRTTTSKPDVTVTVKHTHYVHPTPSTTSSVVVPTTSSTSPPPPPPAPTTTSAPITTEAPPPAPTTTEVPAPAPETTTSETPAVVTTTPVVQAVEASPIVAAAAASSPTDLASAGVYYHNLHRTNHSAAAVTWDAGLATSAQTLADTCNFHHDQTIGGGGYGQNIDSQGMSGDGVSESVPKWDPKQVLANAITNNWYYAEEPAFPYNVASPTEGATQIFHFSQVVWKTTTTVGCAASYCDTRILSGNYGWFVVCNYGPAGNYLGEFATDVTKPVGDPAVKVATPWA